MDELIHIHKNRLNTNYTIVLLLIPPLVFVLVMAVSLSRLRPVKVSVTQNNTHVLGNETDSPGY